jgi:hypothetical protein
LHKRQLVFIVHTNKIKLTLQLVVNKYKEHSLLIVVNKL